MKKILLVAFVLITSTNLFSQNFSYGVVLGGFYQDFENKGPFTPSANYSLFDFGAFGDYKLNSFSGIVAKLTYSAKVVDEGYSFSNQYVYTRSEEIHFNAINFTTHYKFDTNKEYGKGFYVLAGPRLSFILNAEDKNGEDYNDLYKSTRFTAQLGFGVNFLKHYGTELLFDYGLSNPLDSENNDSQTYGVNFNFTINLESIINK